MEQAAAPDVRSAVGGGSPSRDLARVRSPLSGASLSRAEIALRKATQDWALACNTKQLDDLVDLYLPDATVLRPNVPAVRGAAAIREFFFGLLDAGMSEVEMDPQRAGIVRRLRLRGRALQVTGPERRGQAARGAWQISGPAQSPGQRRLEDSG